MCMTHAARLLTDTAAASLGQQLTRERLSLRRRQAERNERSQPARRATSADGALLRRARHGVRRLVPGRGLFADEDRHGWAEEVVELLGLLAKLPTARALDLACGTGFLTRHLPGPVVGLDQSPLMLSVATQQAPNTAFLRGDALELPFAGRSLDRVFASHFYGHLRPDERSRFLRETRRVAPELVIVDAALREGIEAEQWQERILNEWQPLARLQTLFHRGRTQRRACGRETLFVGRSFVASRSAAATTWPEPRTSTPAG
jgi:SAM-dependent methyltransferase